MRMFRPFPALEIAKALSHLNAVAVLDRAESFSDSGGALFCDITSALCVNKININVINYIYGLGGRDVKTDDIEFVYNELKEMISGKAKSIYNYLGVRGE